MNTKLTVNAGLRWDWFSREQERQSEQSNMGVGVGTFADSACTLLTNGSIVTQAGSTAQLSGTLDAGSYCVMVYDAGNQVATVNYAVTVDHY